MKAILLALALLAAPAVAQVDSWVRIHGGIASYLDLGDKVLIYLSAPKMGGVCSAASPPLLCSKSDPVYLWSVGAQYDQMPVYCYLSAPASANCPCLLEKLLGSDIYQGQPFKLTARFSDGEWQVRVLREPDLDCD